MDLHISIPNTFEVTETVDKPSQAFFCRDVGMISDVAFPTTQFCYRLNYKSQNKNSNYYIPYSHNYML